jgi:plasmid stability protein
MVSKRFHNGVSMPTLTLKNIPADLHAKLKASAARNRRSLNSEILARLEAGPGPASADRETYSRDLRAFTDALPKLDHRLIPGFKARGRA